MRRNSDPRLPCAYQPLGNFLQGNPGKVVMLSFVDIEAVLGRPLPPSAYLRRGWWGNHPSLPQAHAWLAVGWKTRAVKLSLQTVSFVRLSKNTQTYA